MLIGAHSTWLKEDLCPVLLKEIREMKGILIVSLAVAFLFTGFVFFLFPGHFAQIEITATGRKGSEHARAVVVWLMSPDLTQINSQELIVQKSQGWEQKERFLVSTKTHPAELQLTGYFFLDQTLQFSSTPYSGLVEIETNGEPKIVDLFQPSQGMKPFPLNRYLSVNHRQLSHTLSGFLMKLIRNFFLLTCFLVFLRVIHFKYLRPAFLIGCLVITVNVLFLISPRAPESLITTGDVFLYDIRGPLHLTINIDSWDFLDLGRDPRLMFTEKHQRFQGRPLYSALGFLLSLPFRPFRSEWIAAVFNPLAYYFPEVIGYAILNAIVLTVSILIFFQLVECKLSFDWLLLLPLTIFTANEVTKAFFWTPHLQVFNLVIPILSLMLYWGMLQRLDTLRLRHFLLIGGVIGVCALAYPGFGSVVLGAMLLVLLKSKQKFAAFLMPVTFYVPILLWRMIVVLSTGRFYDAEVVEGRLFTWAMDIVLDFDAFKVAFVKNIGDFSLTLIQVMSVPVFILICLMAFRYRYQAQSKTSNPIPQELRIAFWIYYASAVPFLFLIGIYRTRLSYCLVPPLLVLIGRELKNLEGIWTGRPVFFLKVVTLMYSFGHLIYWVLRKGPWS